MIDFKRYGFHRDEYIFSEHPDPSWARRNWLSLDGEWTIMHRGIESKIQVPFPIGSKYSGVDFRDSGTFVYNREFTLPRYSRRKRYILKIGASDYKTSVQVNGIDVGNHIGGYATFSLDITKAVKDTVNKITVRVTDSHSPYQVRGKQTFLRNPFFVWYSGISGIWQSIWIEETGPGRLERAETKIDFTTRRIAVTTFADTCPAISDDMKEAYPAEGAWTLSVTIKSPQGNGKPFTATVCEQNGNFVCTFGFDDIDAAFWSHAEPNLHAMVLSLSRNGVLSDEVESYFGIRDITVDRDGIHINGEKVFLKMALIQGYFPGGSYTPESYARMENDLRFLKMMGFNGARIHEKAENPYFSYLCDRLGVLTTFEMPSFYLPSPKAFARYEAELKELIRRDMAHPSCIMRMLFNETWGIWGIYRKNSKTRRFILAMYDLAKRLDPSRPVIDNSGWEHIQTDIADFHHYLRNASLARDVYKNIREKREKALFGFSIGRTLAFYFRNQVSTKTRPLFLEASAAIDNLPLFLSEYGGFGWYDTEHEDAVIENIEEYTHDIIASRLFCGYCYTQLYDVGAEVNGLMSFNRQFKVDIGRVLNANSEPT